jgi:Cof subfamily protein (haloacid dehalogenase superfamily)
MAVPNDAQALVFFDIDGTLLNEKRQVPTSAVAAIRQLRQNGHLAFLNTGRSKAGIHDYILDVQFDGIIAACGTYIEYQGRQLLNQTIDPGIFSTLLPLVQANGIDAFFEGPQYVYFEGPDPRETSTNEILKDYFRAFFQVPGVVLDWRQSPVVANKMCYLLRPESQPEPVDAFLKQYFTVISHHPDPLFEVIQLGFSKATGMQFILEHLDLPQEQTFAFGDSLNDIEMLKFAQYGIAMGGSRNRVLIASDHVTSSVSEHGIAEALKHFGLI